ncbi:hypothetical protein [Pleomorphomonas sp. NRK KF1]|uniref:hypothetical protein n=1 Tax=Pleomorphomonas sp. NRK KF1 TaxID=2943000 RepID=UPI0020442196|nr:hypothetical protein [Pleomorphomonas sp. NRK KF1]MCM5553138.1 hypothetical protein [Pleomorphomonas sp. NRK KF1]
MTRDRRTVCVESINACLCHKPYVNLQGATREAKALKHLAPTPDQKAALDHLVDVLTRIVDDKGDELTRDNLSDYWRDIWSAKEAVVDLYIGETGSLLPWIK